MSDLALRPATPRDRDFVYGTKRDGLASYVVATWGEWDDDWQRRRFDERFDCARHRIVEVGGAAVGFIETANEADSLRIVNIALVPAARNRGVGSAVIAHISRDEKRPLRLRVLKVNPARRLYERLGFRIVGDPEVHWWEMVKDGHGD